ncbi:MAG: rod shape-determining protein MreC [Bacteroidota bacterium]
MFSLRNLLNRPGAVGIFIILQTICFLLIIYGNDRQGTIFFGSTDSFFGSLQQRQGNFQDRLAYKTRYDSLLSVHTNLKAQQASAQYDNRVLIDSTNGDTAYLDKYLFYPAKVIKNSVTVKNNYLILNKGSKHRIKRQMGVIDDKNGIVGIVVAVNQYYSRVISILHTRVRVTAQIKSNEAPGSLRWDTSDPKYLFLEGIPSHVEVILGDIVETSEFSRIFPPGITIGTIVEKSVPPGSSTYRIKVELINDLNNVKGVMVVDHLHEALINEIEEPTSRE